MSSATMRRDALTQQLASVVLARERSVDYVAHHTPMRLERVCTALAQRIADAHVAARLACAVLVVDDDALCCDQVARVLRRALASRDGRPVPVYTARSAEEARSLWLSLRPPPAVLLTDLALGAGASGDELAMALGRLSPGLRVVILSGVDETTVRRAAAVVGGVSIQKGAHPDVIVALVQAELDHATPP